MSSAVGFTVFQGGRPPAIKTATPATSEIIPPSTPSLPMTVTPRGVSKSLSNAAVQHFLIRVSRSVSSFNGWQTHGLNPNNNYILLHACVPFMAPRASLTRRKQHVWYARHRCGGIRAQMGSSPSDLGIPRGKTGSRDGAKRSQTRRVEIIRSARVKSAVFWERKLGAEVERVRVLRVTQPKRPKRQVWRSSRESRRYSDLLRLLSC